MGRKTNKKGQFTCWKKIKYKDKETAVKFLRQIRKQRKTYGKGNLKAYKCNLCGGWHLGHPE